MSVSMKFSFAFRIIHVYVLQVLLYILSLEENIIFFLQSMGFFFFIPAQVAACSASQCQK